MAATYTCTTFLSKRRGTLEKNCLSSHKKTSFARSLAHSVTRRRAKRIRVVSVTAIKRAVNHKAASARSSNKLEKQLGRCWSNSERSVKSRKMWRTNFSAVCSSWVCAWWVARAIITQPASQHPVASNSEQWVSEWVVDTLSATGSDQFRPPQSSHSLVRPNGWSAESSAAN